MKVFEREVDVNLTLFPFILNRIDTYVFPVQLRWSFDATPARVGSQTH